MDDRLISSKAVKNLPTKEKKQMRAILEILKP
jgi:hypothetical protein